MKKNCVYDKWVPVGSCDSSCKQNWKLTVKQEGENGGTACVPESRRNATTYCQYQFTPWKLDTTCTINNGKCQKAWRIGTTQPQCDSLIPENRRTVWIDCPSNACTGPASTTQLKTPSPTTSTQYPLSTDGKCGPKHGTRCPTGQCCNKDSNTCVATSKCKDDIRANRIYIQYSDANEALQYLLNENKNLKVATDGRCNKFGDYQKCPNGGCCKNEEERLLRGGFWTNNNFCEWDKTKCSTNRGQYDYLYSDDKYLKDLLNNTESELSCGPEYGGKKCNNGCCHNNGYCTSNINHCKVFIQDYTTNIDYSDDKTKEEMLKYANDNNICGSYGGKRKCPKGCCQKNLHSCVYYGDYEDSCWNSIDHVELDYTENALADKLRKLKERKDDDKDGCGPNKGKRKCKTGCCSNWGTCDSNLDSCRKNFKDYQYYVTYSDDNAKSIVLDEFEKNDQALCGPHHGGLKCKVGCCSNVGGFGLWKCTKNRNTCLKEYANFDPDYSENNIGNEIRKLKQDFDAKQSSPPVKQSPSPVKQSPPPVQSPPPTQQYGFLLSSTDI